MQSGILGSWGALGGLLGALGELLGSSWALLGGSWALLQGYCRVLCRSWLVAGSLGEPNRHFVKACFWIERGHYFLGLGRFGDRFAEILGGLGAVSGDFGPLLGDLGSVLGQFESVSVLGRSRNQLARFWMVSGQGQIVLPPGVARADVDPPLGTRKQHDWTTGKR